MNHWIVFVSSNMLVFMVIVLCVSLTIGTGAAAITTTRTTTSTTSSTNKASSCCFIVGPSLPVTPPPTTTTTSTTTRNKKNSELSSLFHDYSGWGFGRTSSSSSSSSSFNHHHHHHHHYGWRLSSSSFKQCDCVVSNNNNDKNPKHLNEKNNKSTTRNLLTIVLNNHEQWRKTITRSSSHMATSSAVGLMMMSTISFLGGTMLVPSSSWAYNNNNNNNYNNNNEWSTSIIRPTPTMRVTHTTTNYPSQLLSNAQEEEDSVLDEVWNLIKKYYIDQSFRGQDWDQIREKYQALIRKNSSNSNKNNNKNDDKVMMQYITDMVASLGDKYTRILDKNQYAEIQKFDLIGVGVNLMPNDNKQIIVGSPPVPGSASEKAGLQMGDYVMAINGIPTKGRTAFDIIDQISDNPNAKTITMTIQTKPSSSSSSPSSSLSTTTTTTTDEEEEEAIVVEKEKEEKEKEEEDDVTTTTATTRDVVMERQFQEVINPIRYKLTERKDDGWKVGFVRILEFNALVESKLEEALEALEEQGANAYVIDLRMNTGGAFQSAVEISSFFMEDQVATYVIDNTNQEIPFTTAKGKVIVDRDDPLVIWIDGFTASASEVLAGSLHDNCRAVIMGDKSFGKGLIQAVYGLKNGAGLVLTVAEYITPNGNHIQGTGIIPDMKGNLPLPIPGIGSDTSRVNFREVQQRLDPSYCSIPPKQQ